MISVIEPVRFRRAWPILTVFCLLLNACWSSGCSRRPPAFQVLSGTTMGTTWMVKCRLSGNGSSRDGAAEKRAALLDAIGGELETVNNLMSVFRRQSEISRFNRAQGTSWVRVSPELASLIETALEIHRLSRGALDITVGPVIRLWGFGPGGKRRVPADAEIDAALARTGGNHLEVRMDPPSLRKRIPDLECNLSSLAKGYGVDRVARLLDEQGISDYLVEIGGEMRARGQRPGGGPWQIGVMEPEASGGLQRVIPLDDRAMATSGDYQNFFEIGGVRYSHTMDPRTGRPVTHNLASVTVVANTCMEADAWATALLVMGPVRAMDLAREKNIPAFFIERTGDGYREFTTVPFRRLAGNDPGRGD